MSRMRVKVRLTGWRGRRSAGWLVGMLVGLLAGLVALVSPGQRFAVVDAAPGPLNPLAPDSPPYFYVTEDSYTGNEVLDACNEGYHVASLWELQEASRLTYAVDHPAAKVQSDSGQGPPSNWYGWVRTGATDYANNVEGRANCLAWTNAEPGNYGTIARLSADWSQPATAVSPWESQTWVCSGAAPTWCVSDLVYDGFLPVLGNGQ